MSADKPKKRQSFSMHLHETQPQNFIEVLDLDTRPVSDHIRAFATKQSGPYREPTGPVEVPTRWYTDPDIYKTEVEKIWKRKWQMACRVENLPEAGDTFVYDVAGLSFVIVRVSEDLIKGYWNSCLHRGVPLRTCSGHSGGRFQCPFHGFTWDLHGKNIMIPHPEQFPHIDPENFSLPEVQVAQWKGFIFINPDLEADSLESHIGPLSDDDHIWPYQMEFSFHVAKVFSGNWKSLQEAFMESFHVLTTHPQTVEYAAADRCSEFGASGNISVGVLSLGLSNEYLRRTPEEQQIYKKMNEIWDDEEIPEELILPEGLTGRQVDAENKRNRLREAVGSRVDETSDTEISDIFYWSVFPNFHPFGIYTNPLTYNFRPHENDPDKSVMDIYFFKPIAKGTEPEPAPERILLGIDEEYSSVKELAYFGAFISQDSSNMNNIIKGLRNNQRGFVNFAYKYESKIRHFYSCYEKVIGLSAEEEVAALKQGSNR